MPVKKPRYNNNNHNAGRYSIIMIRFLDHDPVDLQTYTPLRRAVNCGHREFVALLLAHGADVNTRDKRGRTPLQAARRPDMVALLRARGAI